MRKQYDTITAHVRAIIAKLPDPIFNRDQLWAACLADGFDPQPARGRWPRYASTIRNMEKEGKLWKLSPGVFLRLQERPQ